MIVFTTFPDGAVYTPKMLESFDKLWPKDVKMIAFYEETPPEYKSDRIEYRSCRDFQSLVDFRNRHKDKNGKIEKGYNYNRDAVKFAACSIVRARMIQESGGRILWLDGDSYTRKPIDMDFIDSTLPEGYFSCFLGRQNFHTETGFLGFDASHPIAETFGQEWEEYYTKDTIFDLNRWHDCEIYDTLRDKYASQAKFNNLTPHAKGGGHVFVEYFGDYMDHLKGGRKALGESPELKKR